VGDAEVLGHRLAAVLLEDGGAELVGPEPRPPVDRDPGPRDDARPPDPPEAAGQHSVAAVDSSNPRSPERDSTERAL
jgi:hydroxymethylbilane synthase